MSKNYKEKIKILKKNILIAKSIIKNNKKDELLLEHLTGYINALLFAIKVLENKN